MVLGDGKMDKAVESSSVKAPGVAFTFYIWLLNLAGVVTSIYLTWLFYATRIGSKGGNIDTFCNINEGLNCVTVANSPWSNVFGVPVAILGLEFFTLILVGLVFALSKRFRFESWDSLMFLAYLIGIPVCITLGLIAKFVIQSVCIMCAFIYLINFTIALSIAIRNRFKFKQLFINGPKMMLERLRNFPVSFVIFAVFGIVYLAQFAVWPADQLTSGVKSITFGDSTMVFDGLSIGPKDAPIKIEEYTDYECPFCARAHVGMMKVLEKFPGKVHFTHKDYPLDNDCNPVVNKPFHRNACRAARFGRCAAKQEMYWNYEHLLFEKKNGLSEKALLEYAKKAGLDIAELKECVASGQILLDVQKDIDEGIKMKVQGTPTYRINGGKEPNVVGFRPVEFWEKQVKLLLKKNGK